MTKVSNVKDNFARIIAVTTLVMTIATGSVTLINFFQNKKTQTTLNKIKVTELLDEAWAQLSLPGEKLITKATKPQSLKDTERLDRAKKLARGKRYAKPELSMSVSRRTLFCKVIHVGDDYVLVSYGEAEKRRVLPKHMIKRVYWSEGLPQLYASARVGAVDTDETEQR